MGHDVLPKPAGSCELMAAPEFNHFPIRIKANSELLTSISRLYYQFIYVVKVGSSIEKMQILESTQYLRHATTPTPQPPNPPDNSTTKHSYHDLELL